MLRIRQPLVAAALAAILGACSDSTTAALGKVDVSMQQTSSVLAQVVDGWYGSATGSDGAAAALPADTIESLTVRVTSIQFLPVENAAQESDASAWITLDLSAPVILDLMTLPTGSDSPLVIASGSVPVGQYTRVRLFTDSAAVTFKGPITLGAAVTFDGGTVYQVTIPSGTQTGIKTDVSFTVAEGTDGTATDVGLVFNPSATFRNVSVTGADTVMLAPVIQSK